MVKSRKLFSKMRFFALILAVSCIAVSLGYIPFSKVDASISSESPVISDTYLRGVAEGLSCAKLKSIYTNEMHGCEYKLYTSKGSYISTSQVNHVVSTGDYILDGKEKKYVVVVTGDINGDGAVKLSDTAIIKMHFSQTVELENEYFEAADTNNDNRVTATDYLRIKYHIQSKYNIHENESFDPDASEPSVEPPHNESGWTSGWI